MRFQRPFILAFALCLAGCFQSGNDTDPASPMDAAPAIPDSTTDGDAGQPTPMTDATRTVDAASGTDGSRPTPTDAAPPPVTDAASRADAAPQPMSPLPAGCIVVGEHCNPNAPDNDPVGQVCANDGREDEAYCTYDRRGRMVCARMETGGPCESAPEPDGPGPDPEPPVEPGHFMVSAVSMNDPLARFFSQELTVFGVRIVAAGDVPVAKLTHAAAIMAEYLDNDEDGAVDDPPVVQAMQRRRALLIMFATADALEGSGLFESDIIDGYHAQDLQADETNMPGRFDAALEEVLHLITTAGYEVVYPNAFGSRPGTRLTDAMDLARGGRFEAVPARYPDAAWYHYDDRTCSYRCMAVEYFYWALTTQLGAQSDPARCREISREWELCTPDALRTRDPAVHSLLTDPDYSLPTRLPDGRYIP